MSTTVFRQAKDFAADSYKASILFIVSSYSINSDILDDPERYGLPDFIEEEEGEPDNSEDERQKAMWVDDIHLSTAGHRAPANRLWTIFQR